MQGRRRMTRVHCVRGQLVLSTLSVKYVRFNSAMGTSRTAVTVADEPMETTTVDVALTSTTLPFVPAALTWTKLNFTVPIKKTKTTPAFDKQLLFDVKGAARPGRMVALMGASGAGKTTLLNVLAQRIASGTATGDIRVGGKTLDDVNFQVGWLTCCVSVSVSVSVFVSVSVSVSVSVC